MNWFDVDRDGLAKLVARKGKAFVVFELVQNSLDENVSRVDVALKRIEGTRYATLSVTDDSPEGFENLAQSWILFHDSRKVKDAEKRGRWCLGEKLVLALCRDARISSTTGTVIFDAEGRRKTSAKRAVGTEVQATIKMTTEEIAECAEAMRKIILPAGVTLSYNGTVLEQKLPVRSFDAALQTELANAEGVLQRVTRTTEVKVYVPENGRGGWLYEMGIPVQEIGCPFDLNVMQKVPLNFDRDSVPVAYVSKIRALLLNAASDLLTSEEARATWVKDAMDRFGQEVGEEAVQQVATLRYGSLRVAHDPGDPEASKRAASMGYVVVYGGNMSGGEWSAMKRAGAIQSASDVTPTPKPFSRDGEQLKMVDPERWTPSMAATVRYIERLGELLLGKPVSVRIASDVAWPFAAAYGAGTMTINLGRVGHRWFGGRLEPINDLVLHELAHEASGDHLSSKYHEALTRLGAQMVSLALERPELFERAASEENLHHVQAA